MGRTQASSHGHSLCWVPFPIFSTSRRPGGPRCTRLDGLHSLRESVKHMGPPGTPVPETHPPLKVRELPFKMQIPLYHS